MYRIEIHREDCNYRNTDEQTFYNSSLDEAIKIGWTYLIGYKKEEIEIKNLSLSPHTKIRMRALSFINTTCTITDIIEAPDSGIELPNWVKEKIGDLHE